MIGAYLASGQDYRLRAGILGGAIAGWVFPNQAALQMPATSLIALMLNLLLQRCVRYC